MTGSRDIEGMFVFTVGRVMNAWFMVDIIDALKEAYPYLMGTTYRWVDTVPFFIMVDNL